MARRAKRLEARTATLLGDLHAMQAALVPEVPAQLAAEGVSVAYRPADGVAAGGDFYDVFELDRGQVALVLGDVCGHGREALERAALTRYTVRAYLQAGLQPRAALALAGRALGDSSAAHFATVVAGVYEPAEGRLTYACAGHPAPIFLGTGAPLPIELCCSPPVGAGLPTGRRQSSISLSNPSTVCFFTDGLTEARCEHGLLGTERLTQLLSDLGPQPRANELLRRVTEEANRTPDDMAACVLLAQGTGEPAPRVEEVEVDRRSLEGEQVAGFLAACGMSDPEAQELLAQADQLLEDHLTAVLRIELAGAATRACASGQDDTPWPANERPSENGGVTSPLGTPAPA